MSDIGLQEPKAIEDMTDEEAQHPKVEHVLALSSREKKANIAKGVKAKCKGDKVLIGITFEALRKEKVVHAVQKRHQKHLGQSIDSRVLSPDCNEADRHIEEVQK